MENKLTPASSIPDSQLLADAKVFLSNHQHYQPPVGSDTYEAMLYLMVCFAGQQNKELMEEIDLMNSSENVAYTEIIDSLKSQLEAKDK